MKRLAIRIIYTLIILQFIALNISYIGAQTNAIVTSPVLTNDTLLACVGKDVYISSVLDTSQYTLSWNFPVGGSSTMVSQGIYRLKFNTPGFFRITLAAVSTASTINDTVWAEVIPTFSASFPGGNPGICEYDEPVTLNQGLPAGGVYFGPGVQNDEFNPTLAGPGIHQVGYTLSNQFYCSDTVYRTFSVSAGADASISDQSNFAPFTNCLSIGSGASYTLTINNSSQTIGVNNSYYIDWGDGSVPYQNAVLINGLQHTYTSAGRFKITVVASAPGLCADTNTYHFFNGKNPNVGIGIGSSQGCAPFEIAIPVLNTNLNPPGTVYIIDFGDGDSLNLKHPTPDTIFHTYHNSSCGLTSPNGYSNAYSVEIKAVNPCGETSVFAGPIEVSEAPGSSPTPDITLVCTGDTIPLPKLFSGGTYIQNGNCYSGTVTNWQISPQNNFSIFTNNGIPHITFTKGGVYQACQSVVHPCLQDSGCINIYVSEPPEVQLLTSVAANCVPAVAQFDNLTFLDSSIAPVQYSYVVQGPAGGYSVLFGGDLKQESVDLEFTLPGVYTIGFFAKNHCDSVYRDTTVVFGDLPSVSFTGDTVLCPGEILSYGPADFFLDTAYQHVLSVYWEITPAQGWSFTGGSQPGNDYPTLRFNATGTYQVKKIIETSCGKDSAVQWVKVYPLPGISIQNQPPLCHNSTGVLHYQVDSGFSNIQMTWTANPPCTMVAYQDSLIFSDLVDTTAFYVLLEDSLGCQSVDSVVVAILPELNLNILGLNHICKEDTFQLFSILSGGSGKLNYNWSPGKFLIDSTVADPVGFGITDPVSFYVAVADSFNCYVSDSILISPYLPGTVVNAGPDTTYCLADYAEPLSGSPANVLWYGPGVDSGYFNPLNAGPGHHVLYMEFIDSTGCSFMDSITVNVTAPDTVYAGADTIICQYGNPLKLEGFPAGGTWSVNGPDSLIANAFFLPQLQGSFELYYTTGAGSCQLTDTVFYVVEVAPTITSPGSMDVCSGDSAVITMISNIPSAVISWDMVDSGLVSGLNASGNSSPKEWFQSASAQMDTVQYAVWASLAQGCTGDTAIINVIIHPAPAFKKVSDTLMVCPGEVINYCPELLTDTAFLEYYQVPMGNAVVPPDTGFGCVHDSIPALMKGGWRLYKVTTYSVTNAPCAPGYFDLYVHVTEPPITSLGPDITICYNDSVQLPASYPKSALATLTVDGSPQSLDTSDIYVSNKTTLTQAEMHQYILMVYDTSTGCLAFDTLEITLLPPQDVEPDSVMYLCAGDSIELGLGNDPLLQYLWVSDSAGLLSTASHLILAPDHSQLIRIYAHDTIHGCVDSSLFDLRVIAQPEAKFELAISAWCNPVQVQVSDSSSSASTYLWYQNGLLIDTVPNPVISVVMPAGHQDSTIEITLVALNQLGCMDSATRKIEVSAPPSVSYSATDVCHGDTTSFIDSVVSSFGHNLLFWDFGDGALDSGSVPVHYYNSPGTYLVQVQLIDSVGCLGYFSDTVYVYAIDSAEFQLTNGCKPDTLVQGQSYTFKADHTPPNSVHRWDANDDGFWDSTSDTLSFSFNDTGVVPIIHLLTGANGCMDSTIQTYHVIPVPKSQFNTDTNQLCSGMTVNVTNTSNGPSDGYEWYLFELNPNGTKQLIFSNYQFEPDSLPKLMAPQGDSVFYELQLVTSYCNLSDTSTSQVLVFGKPKSGFTSSTSYGCTPLSVDFMLEGHIEGMADFAIVDFGDGMVDTVYRQPSIILRSFTMTWPVLSHVYTYNLSGVDTSYFPKVIAVSDCGSDTSSMEIVVGKSQIDAFINSTITQGCAPLTVDFSHSSFNATSAMWCMDYDSTSCGQVLAGDSVQYTFQNPGTFEVALFAGNGCSADTDFVTVVVHPTPQSSFTVQKSCSGDTVFLNNMTSIAGGGMVSSYWDFGDGTSSVLMNPHHYYVQPGTYIISLVSANMQGCKDSSWQSISISPQPLIEFDSLEVCLNQQPVLFSNQSDSSLMNGGSFLWDFGNATTKYGYTVSHTYQSAGTYWVTLKYINADSCVFSVERPVRVLPIPVADIQVSGNDTIICRSNNMLELINPIQSGLSIWQLTDPSGAVQLDTAYNHLCNMSAAGTYKVMLMVMNAAGCIDTAYKTLSVLPGMSMDFGSSESKSCKSVQATFYDLSNTNAYGQKVMIRHWKFGNHPWIPTYDSIISFKFSKPGYYDVQLAITTTTGCVDTLSRPYYVEVLEAPVADFDYEILEDGSFHFLNYSRGPDGLNFTWDFGDGRISNEQYPVHDFAVNRYELDHTLLVSLKVETRDGCLDSTTQEIFMPAYRLVVPNALTPDISNIGEAGVFLPKGNSLKTYLLRIYDTNGHLVFQSDLLDQMGIPREPWDGTLLGNSDAPMPAGVYVWQIYAQFRDGLIWPGVKESNNKYYRHGTITLLR